MTTDFSLDIKNYLNINNLYSNFGLDKNFKVKFLAQGEYNINYILYDKTLKLVFRINTDSQLRLNNQIEYEFNALKLLEGSNVTPKPIYVDGSRKNFPFGILIMEFLKGKPLNYSTDLIKASNIFSKIHTLKVPKNHGLIIENNILQDRIKEGNWLLESFFKSDIPDMKIKNFFEKYINWCEDNLHLEKYFIENPILSINNTEVNSHNFIIGDENYLIDWEKPVLSHPCQDLTQFLADTTTLWRSNYIISDINKDDFLKEYCNKSGFKYKNIKESINIYNPYLYLRALSWCAMAFVKYQSEDKLIKNEEIFLKIKSYLDIDFISKLLKPYFSVD
ncbi:phosphotransferase [Clostridium senegalense]|uniref:phosphotransferase n=1 Tax=Clostridium senegalense TaxID=1465809 RepID=UPI001C1036F0|nr:phosphotransferase [Clostridium senegalense]MBU5226592.1 phosphotransferase [Clostridium senegalense]